MASLLREKTGRKQANRDFTIARRTDAGRRR
jgi:hypothetical protein